ncbi:hypothetical protein BS47DRAFT_1373513 [Hydnum rufescens UP504]|uniref:CxC2-like cysteine cluster KDZ transposase-associated domain-containing protein n=1 Tax=Hydnum rufescens UP504 TaxID=1448309 RepID=A0A9P6APT0_9AGAM|nr:hypothetical protein BS47DRAFT_1373513 [Hydnum rufescens UP504]
MLRHDGHGDSISLACPDCGGPADEVIYRCEECMLDELLYWHARLPFHRIKKWTGSLFEKVHLADLGIHIQFGHTSCLLPKEIPSGLVIVHVNGLHLLFPATISHPKLCATLQSLQSKISTIHFFQALERETDNTGLSFHKLLIQGRHAHDPTGAYRTQPGELAVVCPTCPINGVNLPRDWMEAPRDQQYLYYKISSVNANFKLSNRDTKGEDPGLSTGHAYFVPDKEYKEWLSAQRKPTEASTCTDFSTIKMANTKNMKGLCVTSVGAIVCARHGILHPTGLGDLQKVRHHINTYDIWCNCHIKLLAHHTVLPPHLQLDLDGDHLIDGAIPKFYKPAHSKCCHITFLLNYLTGVGQTDGEGIEHDWSSVNGAARSTKEMGVGSRHNALDDVWGDTNYCKVIGLGE